SPRESAEMPKDGGKSHFFSIPRRERLRQRRRRTRNRNQVGEKRHVDVRRRAPEQAAQLLQLDDVVVVGLKAGGVFDLPDDRMERRVLVMLRADEPNPPGRLVAEILFQRRDQPRLSDTRLAGKQDHAALAVPDLIPATQ